MTKLKRLKRGDKVAIVSLTRGMLGEDKFIHKCFLANQRPENDYGLEVVAMPNALKGINHLIPPSFRHFTARIGETVLEDDGTVSATALYLLKTLTEDKIMAEFDIQMIPCCGHTMFANKELTEVMISGCPNGTDWSTLHEGDSVRLILPSGQEEVVGLSAYREEVLRFAEKVEAYYNACAPKELPTNEYERNGYIAFWNEWHRRYADAKKGAVKA